MRKLVLFLFPFTILSIGVKAQEKAIVEGKVVEKGNEEVVPYANLSVVGLERGTSTGADGRFRFEGLEKGTHRIRVSSVGHKKREKRVKLKAGEKRSLVIGLQRKAYEQDEVVVTSDMKATSASNSSVNVRTLDGEALRSGSAGAALEEIEQVNGLREQVVCGVCGTNGIRINGMNTPYTLVMVDGMPFMGSLGSVYGLNGIPSSILERVEVTKGPASTLYGPRAVAGVVNMITRDPSDMPKASFKGDRNTHGQTDARITLSPGTGSDSLKTFLSVDRAEADQRVDENGDGFTDFPLAERTSLFNKWTWIGKGGTKADMALRYYHEDRQGGEMEWRKGDEGSEEVYGESIETRRMEFLGKVVPGWEENVRFRFSFSDHFQNSFYGTEHFKGKQKNGAFFATWRREYGRHEILGGANIRYEKYRDNTPASTHKEDLIPGIFVQDQWQLDTGMTLTAALRADRHPVHGKILTPRLHWKTELGDRTTLRINSGSGFREVDVFTEDHAALTGSRDVLIEEELRPERSWNLSASLSRSHHVLEGVGSMDLDFFYNRFSNKIVPDLNSDPSLVIYRNLDGHGVSRGIALSLAHRFHFPLELKFGGTYQDVYQVRPNEEEGGKKIAELYAPRFTGNFKAKGSIPALGLDLEWKGTVVGPQRLPRYPEPFHRPEWSPWYSLHHLNLSRSIGSDWSIYGGVKNLFDHTQSTPLVDPENPFSERFDTEYVYGPMQGRRFYIGLEWSIPQNDDGGA